MKELYEKITNTLDKGYGMFIYNDGISGHEYAVYCYCYYDKYSMKGDCKVRIMSQDSFVEIHNADKATAAKAACRWVEDEECKYPF